MRCGRCIGSFPFWIASRAFSRRTILSDMLFDSHPGRRQPTASSFRLPRLVACAGHLRTPPEDCSEMVEKAQLIFNVGMLVTLCLLTSVATAHAECVWVLSQQHVAIDGQG